MQTRVIGSAVWLVGAAAACVAQTPAGDPQPGATAVVVVEPPGEFASAGDLLDELEAADRGLRRLSAGVSYTKLSGIAGDVQERVGTLYFSADSAGGDAAGTRRFSVIFDRLYLGRRVEDQRQVLIFDGQWLVEKYPDQKRMVKQQVVAPGEVFDPLRLGEGPFPIPIGQKRGEILARYDANLADAAEGLAFGAAGETPTEEDLARSANLRAFSAGCVQLVLTPRADSATEDEFTEIRLWYRRDAATGRLLPRLARTRSVSEDESVVMLINPRLDDDAEIPAEAMDTSAPASGWDVDIREWRGPAGPGR